MTKQDFIIKLARIENISVAEATIQASRIFNAQIDQQPTRSHSEPRNLKTKQRYHARER